jgi:hypothetical protein
VKFSLISATSIIALFSAAVGPADAGTLMAAPGQTNLYDLVHDGMTSSDGGDGTVPLQDLSVTAVNALETQIGGLRIAGFTGKADGLVAAGNAYPAVPLNAAAGSRATDDLVTPVVPAGQYETQRKARAVGEERMAALIGTIGNGPATDAKSGSTVFVTAGNSASFNDGGEPSGARTTSMAYQFAPSSSGTATMTVAGAVVLARQSNGNGLSVISANSLQSTSPTGVDSSATMTMTDRAQPTMGYEYAPTAISATVSPAGRDNTVPAVFSDAVTATGAQVADRVLPATMQTSQVQTGNGKVQTSQVQTGNGKVQTSQVQTGNGKVQTSQVQPTRSGQIQTSEAAAALSKLLDLTQPGPRGATQADGTRTFLSASVSANPVASTALYMADAVNAAPAAAANVSVEAFQIGPVPGTKAQASVATTVADPLHGKILASAGPLNSNLALP